ncbi:MAG: cryptochrome/photolyase family protein [Chlamydiales bacterium]
MKRALFIFRRDLRLQDNRGLLSALKAADEVILSFIFTPEQIEQNVFRSDRCLQFMIESLEDLEIEISEQKGRLHLFYGKPEKIVQECIKKLEVRGVFVNHDYSPYSIQRDQKIIDVCNQLSVSFQAAHDLLLHPIEDTLKRDGQPYTIFTPFYRNASKLDVCRPEENSHHRYYAKTILFSEERSIYKKILKKRKIQAPGGRQAGLEIINHLETFSKYASEKELPALDKTTHLSAHLKFTTCSTREVYYAIINSLGPHSELIWSLYWRDFFTLIAFHFPHVFKGAFKAQFDHLAWKNDERTFNAWCQGKTGFPIVDAGMRELNQTGFMHNRVRMITASFLIKDLHLSWQWGEKYFAQHLIDYDPAVNNGNWQWAASTGCDAQPYFRIFNPWLQAKKFDSNCVYIKRWVPELDSLPPEVIHTWYLKKYHGLCKDYPPSLIDHSREAAITLKSYQRVATCSIKDPRR